MDQKQEMQSKGQVREGVVVSDKMNKTRVVEVTRILTHAQYKKTIRRKIKYAVHDEQNQSKAGDKVRIIQTQPLSKTKRWRLIEVLAS